MEDRERSFVESRHLAQLGERRTLSPDSHASTAEEATLSFLRGRRNVEAGCAPCPSNQRWCNKCEEASGGHGATVSEEEKVSEDTA